ncbi:hypothetical protein THO17_32640 [Marinomonas sp. THO17]
MTRTRLRPLRCIKGPSRHIKVQEDANKSYERLFLSNITVYQGISDQESISEQEGIKQFTGFWPVEHYRITYQSNSADFT